MKEKRRVESELGEFRSLDYRMLLNAEKFTVTVLDDPWTELGLIRASSPLNPNPTTPLQFSRPAKVVWSAIATVIMLHVIVAAGLVMNMGGAAHRLRNGLTSGSATEGAEVISVLSLIPDEPPETEESSLKALTDPIQELITPKALSLGAPNIKNTSINQPTLSVSNFERESGRTPQTIYRDQIKARVERTWYEINGGSRRLAIGGCEVKINQSALGEVRQVEFQSCAALPIWKESLDRAIRQASPLPAPPDEKVFSDEVMLEF